MDAGKKSINDIFNGNRVLEIPFFQRAYVWGKDQWERLHDDMEKISKENRPYFLGSVILKQQPTSTADSVGDRRILIDGQQRLTTIGIFFKCLCLKSGRADMFNRIFRLMSNDEIAIRHNHNNIESFNLVMNLNEEACPENRNDAILSAYHFFKDNIDPAKLDLNNILARILFVVIDLGVQEDEQQIFDTINSLGVTLTTAELLKNYFFNRDDISSYEKYWKEVFEYDEKSKAYWDTEIITGRLRRTFIDLFFYSYLQIAIQDQEVKVSTSDKETFSKVEDLFESYKKFIKEYKGGDKESLLHDIKLYAELFRKNFRNDIVEKELTAKPGIERINAIIFGLETSTLISYVLFILRNVFDAQTRDELFETLESYIMRRMVVHANTKGYNILFTDRLISNKILTKESFINLIEKSGDKINYFPSNRELQQAFMHAILINKQAAGILYLIESSTRKKEYHATQLLGLRNYSLEHLMPKKWENHWPKVNGKEEKINRDRKLLTLGNLAIITQALNSSIRDAAWPQKKKGKADKYGLRHFSGGIDTLNQYLDLDTWDETAIENRANDLFQLAKVVWPIDALIEDRTDKMDIGNAEEKAIMSEDDDIALIVENNKITLDLMPDIYETCLMFYQNKCTLTDGSQMLHDKLGMNIGSARVYMNNFRFIIEGKTFKRTLNADSMEYLLTRINKDFGAEKFALAIEALDGHIDYYESCHPGELTKLRKVLAKMTNELESGSVNEIDPSTYWNGYCPESGLKGKQVRMRLNANDFYESEATGLQMAVLPGLQAIIMNFRGEGKFRSTPGYGDEISNDELLSPQTSDKPPFNEGELFQNSTEVEKFINAIK